MKSCDGHLAEAEHQVFFFLRTWKRACSVYEKVKEKDKESEKNVERVERGGGMKVR